MAFSKISLDNFSEHNYNIIFSFLFILSLMISIGLLIHFTMLKIVYVLLSFSIIILLSFDFFLMFSVLLIIIFTPYVLGIHNSTIFSCFLVLPVILTFKFDRLDSFKNPLLMPLLLYIGFASFSIYNVPKTLNIVVDYINLVSFFVLIIIIPIVFFERKRITKIFLIFITAMLLHSFYVIFESISKGSRAFGVLGVFYVDLAGLAGLYSVIFFLYTNGFKKIVFGLSAAVILLGLLLSQTRNAWLSTIVTFLFVLIFLLINYQKYNIKRRMIFNVTLIFIIISFSIYEITINELNVNVGERLESKKQKINITDDPSSIGDNSLLSRLFIWHTALNAFTHEPIIGIGLYSFRYTSDKYYTIPTPFFKQYVKNRTPHVAYLELLVESGVVGLAGFIIFLFSIHKHFFKSLHYIKSNVEIVQSLLILVSIIYISFSMFMTEAWLYGQYLVWFGIITGLVVANTKLLTQLQK